MKKLSLATLTLMLALASCGQQSTPAAAELSSQRIPYCDDPNVPCEPTDPDPDPDPQPPVVVTGDRLRITLTMDYVDAKDTEDVTPTWPSKPIDEFYNIGSVYVGDASTGQGIEQGFATTRFEAKKGRTYYPNQTVFTAVVNPGTQVASVVRAYDEDIDKDINVLKAAAVGYKIASFACKFLCDDPQNGDFQKILKAINDAINFIKSFWSGNVTIDQDDNLKERLFNFGVLTQNQNTTLFQTQNYSEGGLGYSTWNYDVRYRLKVEPTNDPLTTF
ncbi:hypothetical protein IHN32_01715 [Deinococcus sp. 14RED07]|uniref:hypothetical protein n=1 Tax=Deinococcus sp. 14RED07 TaxID=2745874 RepID=UPI001E3ECD7E|nr:hypothetical protein [Deinococcus sp. 14RED07]MCD0174670.1 hypothetical protein [Deinococcus sp. 14RED07]